MLEQQGRLAGRVAVITGAASGIGAATALRFAAEGAKLCLFDQDAERLAEVGEQVGEAGAFFVMHVGDVSEEADVDGCLASVAQLGPPAILVNQAGIIWRGPLHEMKLADWVRVQSVNVTGTFLFCRTFVPAMLDNGGGVIINVASGAAFSAGRNLAAYTCSKGAVLALTRALAVDYAPSIRANALCPGLIDTPGSYRFTGGSRTSDLMSARRASAEKVPLARYGTSEEVADAALFLASDESAFCTGSSLVVDGGKLATS